MGGRKEKSVSKVRFVARIVHQDGRSTTSAWQNSIQAGYFCGGCTDVFDYVGKERRRLRNGTRSFMREVVIGDACIFVDQGFQWDGSRNVWLTRARASYVLGAGPVFELRPRALLARVTGFQGGTPSGDPYFDDFFAVRTVDASETWSTLTTRVRSLLAGSFEDARVISDGHMVALWREGDNAFELDADAAVEAVAEIVRHRNQVLNNLRRLPSAIPLPAHGPWHERQVAGVVLHAPTPVHVTPSVGTRGPHMSAWARCGRAVRRFYIFVDECGQIHGDARRLPKHIRITADTAGSLGSCEIVCDGKRVQLNWTGLDLPREQVLEGARFVSALSRRLTGLYR